MKIANGILSSILFLIFIISFSSPLTSCSKTNTVHDTTVVNDTVYDLQTGLVAYYNFVGGNLNDSSGNGNNIVFNSATVTTDRFGNPNRLLTFPTAVT